MPKTACISGPQAHTGSRLFLSGRSLAAASLAACTHTHAHAHAHAQTHSPFPSPLKGEDTHRPHL